MKRFCSLLLAVLLTVSAAALAAAPAEAATITYNNSGIFQKQKTNYTCTLASAAMMLRRRAIMNGATDWKNITESNMRDTAWVENAGLRNSFTYAGMAVRCEALRGTTAEKKEELISLLSKHPEGIVIYTDDIPHAVFLVDYNPTNDTFICMDPSGTVETGRIKLTKSSLADYVGRTQNKIIKSLNCYWYVKSSAYKIGAYTVSNNGKGIYLRSDATSSYQKLGTVPDGTELTITAVCSKVGQTVYNGKTGWVSLAACEYNTKAYQIAYYKNGGTGSQMETTVCIYGQATPLAQCTYTKSGESFLGWHLYRPASYTWLYTNGTANQWCLEGEEPAGYTKKLMAPGSTLKKGETRYGGQVNAYAQWGTAPAVPSQPPAAAPSSTPSPAPSAAPSPSPSPVPAPSTPSGGTPTTPPSSGGSSAESSAPVTPSMTHFTRSIPYRPGQFSDVNENSWYGSNKQGSVRAACELGLMQGTGGTGFSPTGEVSIAQAVTMAARLHSLYYTGADSFIQPSGDWFAVYMDYALEHGIVPAAFLSDSQWARSTKATRSQCAYILAGALPAEALPQRNSWPTGSIPDVSASAPYSGQIYLLYRAGILSGSDGSGTFRPNSTIQRCEIAAIVARMADRSLRL